MFFKINNEEVRATFRHLRAKRETVDDNGNVSIQYHPFQTICRIFKGDKKIGEGKATCNPLDNFERTRGRKIAFKRALDAAKFTREDRTVAWNNFWNV